MRKRILAFSMVLALVAVMAMPMAAIAATDGTTISGTIQSTATLIAPSDITFASFAVGVNPGNSTTPGSVTANGAGWTLTVSDNKTVTKGYMTLGGTDETALSYPLTLSLTSGGDFGAIGAYQALLQGSANYGTTSAFSIPLYVQQQLLGSDAPGIYSITLTYTVTPGS